MTTYYGHKNVKTVFLILINNNVKNIANLINN